MMRVLDNLKTRLSSRFAKAFTSVDSLALTCVVYGKVIGQSRDDDAA